MFKTETHLHTQEVSPCSHIRAKQMIRKYKEAGYSTVFVTDHFQSGTIDSYGDIPWTDKMSIFFAGYYIAKCEGEKIGINVLPGAEICFKDAPNHYLVYGITREFFDKYPELHTYGIDKFSKIAHENGLFIIQAHPHRDGKCFPTPEYVDGIEVYNSNPRHEDNSELSEQIVAAHGLSVIGGSDAHREEDLARGGIETEVEIKTAEDFINLVKLGNVNVIRGGV